MGTSRNALSALLDAEDRRASTARDLNVAYLELLEAVSRYREAWSGATSAGWAKTDLKRAGFTDPARLPRTKASTTDTPQED